MGNFQQRYPCCLERDVLGRSLRRGPRGSRLESDEQRYNEAAAKEDVPGLVTLLKSNAAYTVADDAEPHSWAESPQSIGSLAASRLAVIIAHAESEQDAKRLRDEVRDAGGITELTSILRHADEPTDRVHCALVALSFLSVDSEENCRQMHKDHLLASLAPLLTSPIPGLRTTALTTAANIFKLSSRIRSEFVDRGGLTALIQHLEIAPNKRDTSNFDAELETVYALSDLLEGDEPETINSEVAEQAVREGVIPRLASMAEGCSDSDLKHEIEELLRRLRSTASVA
ncbi:hypothetical protein FOZ62_024860 [Perkinsus olseni]|uniref:Uncharacterized protein n=2 Tax=Perkinsus olseni TaxID=32597 RepID=A0A7J6RS21_PEROL|nr:hypothetical protein FOZ62_024860 [Perkinsus olseni]